MRSLEAARLATLRQYGLLDAPADDELQAVVRVAALVAGVPTATLNLMDEHRQCQLTTVGFEGADSARTDSMCDVHLLEGRPVLIPDASADPAYANNPWVTGLLADIRFYASVPLIAGGHVLGTLCVFDSEVRTLTEEQMARLEDLGAVIVALFQRRREAREKAHLAADAAEQALLLQLTSQELEARKRLTDAILETISVAVVATDAQGQLTLFNRAAREWHGLDESARPSAAVVSDLRHPDSDARLREHEIPLQRALREGSVDRVEMVIAPEGREPTRVSVSGRALAAPDGSPLGAVVAMTDVTADRAQQAALRAAHDELARSNSELEQFAAVASHDLKSPLTVVSGFLELVSEEGGLPERTLEWVETARRGVARMQGLIDALLGYARAGEGACARQHVPLRDILDHTMVDLRADIRDSRATITAAGELPEVSCDPVLLRQLLQNLLGNALKYRREDRPGRVVVSASGDAAHGWEIAIADNGLGIPAEARDSVFTMFTTLNPHGHTGHGIGLATCQRIVERHGGRIWVDETPGGGTTVRFTLSPE